MSTPIRRIRSGCCACATSGQAAAPARSNVKSRRVMSASRLGRGIVPAQTCVGEGPVDVRFGSKADSCSAATHVRFAPNSDRESGHTQPVMSALPPKADMCGATAHVCFGPKADITFAFIAVLKSGPVIANTCAVALSSLIYQFGEAATKLNIENLLDALRVHAFIMHQRIKLAFY